MNKLNSDFVCQGFLTSGLQQMLSSGFYDQIFKVPNIFLEICWYMQYIVLEIVIIGLKQSVLLFTKVVTVRGFHCAYRAVTGC